jgi:hypothetical protein
MSTYKIYSNNPAFGDGGPFAIDAATFGAACELLAAEMTPTFAEWARDQHCDASAEVDGSQWTVAQYAEQIRREFIAGLTQILHCDECGQDYHEDAPERGHASDCTIGGTRPVTLGDVLGDPTITTRIEIWRDGCWQSCSVSTTAVEEDPCRDHGADLSIGSIASETVYEALEQSWATRDEGDNEVEVEILDENHDQHLWRLRRVW